MSVDLVTIHPVRVNKPEEMQGFLLRESALRVNPSWARWLDAQHPTLEHTMFGDARMGGFAETITVGTEFAAEYLRIHYGEKLKAHFGRTVSIDDREPPRGRVGRDKDKRNV